MNEEREREICEKVEEEERLHVGLQKMRDKEGMFLEEGNPCLYRRKNNSLKTVITHVSAIGGTIPGPSCTTSREEWSLRRSESHTLPLHRS